ncbi:MAG: hypothetical protein GPJ52_02325 [Candidatus Heimdallarchaeota archaeon]|nr:hypothetical protein [Candidatus Heimdallarchaeota archaeon]
MSDNVDYYIHLGIAVRIPMAFEKFCDKNYSLKEEIPEGIDESSEDARVKTIFHIFNKEKEKVATFNPIGEYQCLKDSFKDIFNRMVEDIEYAAYKAKKAQDEIDKKLAERFDEEINLDV